MTSELVKPRLDVCGHRERLIADRDGVDDPGAPNGRPLLGLKGTISERELHTIRSRLTAGLLAKAERGELALPLPVGLVRDASGVVTKTPDREAQARIALVFDTFLQRRTAVRVVRTLHERGLAITSVKVVEKRASEEGAIGQAAKGGSFAGSASIDGGVSSAIPSICM
jgi:DNA invertase Pin-like site-specific DNA recombinase